MVHPTTAAWLYRDRRACPQKPAFYPRSVRIGGIERMHRLPISGAKKYLVTLLAVTFLTIVAGWLGFRLSAPSVARDFEECVEQVEAKAPSNDDRGAQMICGARFAGRRKPGGGYSYFDFMQDRSFDIAGPNPTADERKRIDREYMVFLDAQRREAISAALARRRNEQLQEDMESARQPVGPPMVLTPVSPVPVPAKRPIDRSKYAGCVDGSLSCGWEKFSAALKNAFASSRRSPNPARYRTSFATMAHS
jgi:hypothetical protein